MATYYWVGGNGTWDNSSKTNWSTTSGGTGGSGPPTSADDVNFDTNSGTAAAVTVTSTATCNSCAINKSDINLSLSGSPTFAGNTTLTTGTITLGSNTLTIAVFISNSTAARVIDFGTGNITITGNGQAVWNVQTATNLSYLGTPVVNFTYSGAFGTRNIYFGTPDGATESNAISFNIKAGTDIVNVVGSCKNLDFTGFAGTLTNAARTVYGDLTIASGMTITATTSATTFAATSGTKTITSNGKTLDFPLVFNGVGGTWQLQDNLTIGSTRTATLTNGTIDLTGNSGNWTFTVGVFSSTNSNTRSIIFGTGKIVISNNATTVLDMGTLTGFTYTGTSAFEFNYSGSTGTRIISFGQTGGLNASNAINIKIIGGSDTIQCGSLTGALNEVYSGFTGTSTPNRYLYGSLTLSSGMTIASTTSDIQFLATSGTQQITSNSVVIARPITVNASGATFQPQDNLTLGSTRTFTLTAGTLDLTGNSGNWTLSAGLFNTNSSSTRSITFGTGNITLTGSGTVWYSPATSNFSYTGTPTINVSNNSATATTVTTGAMTAAQALNFNYTIGTYTLTDNNAVYNNVNFTGFTGTLGNAARTIYGNLIVVAGMTMTAGANATTFAATSGTKQITTNAQTLDFPLTFNGIGGTFAFQDALTQGSTRAFTITNGTVQLKAGVTSTTGALATSGTNQKVLQSTSAGSQATLSQASGNFNAQYLTVKDIAATGGAKFNALNNCITQGSNSGWYFAPQLGKPLPMFAF